jgi:hypothetical protein
VWWLLWVVVVVAAALLSAYLVDRRRRVAAGPGMSDRDRQAAERIVRGYETRSDSFGCPGNFSGGA